MKQINFSEIKINGNTQTAAMHLYTFHELKKMHVRQEMPLNRIVPEQTVLLSAQPPKIFSERKGRFDFLAETEKGKTIGIEVLTRPTQGKMKQKLSYAEQVDAFIFVLPHDSLLFYQKPKTKIFHKKSKPKFFSSAFANPKLHTWLLDTREGRFTQKGIFSKIFNVKK